MKKKIIGGIAVLTIAAAAAFNVSLNAQEENLSNISLANVEALANGEGVNINCSDFCDSGGPGCQITVTIGGSSTTKTCDSMHAKSI